MHTTQQRKTARCTARDANPRTSTCEDPWSYGRSCRKTRAEKEYLTTWVYQYFDANDVLLYVGLTDSPGARGAGHERIEPWFEHIARTTYARFERRSHAEAEEARLIRAGRPLHNRNSGIRKKHWTHAPQPVGGGMAATSPAHATPEYLLHDERVLVTLSLAEKPLSIQEIRRRTPGNTQSVRDAIDEVLASGKAVAEKGANGYRIVLADRQHLLTETVVKQVHGTIRDRILAALVDASSPMPINEVKRRTRGKTRRISEEIESLLHEGTLVETSGPRQARLITLKP